MALSKEEVTQIAKASAQAILEGLHRYAVDYKEPGTIEQGLQDSMIEERTASSWYKKRAENAETDGDVQTGALYRIIAYEEDHHYDEFNTRLQGINGKPMEHVPALEIDGPNKIMYHATERESVDRILGNGLKAPAYMMNGRLTVGRMERAARGQKAYLLGQQVLLKIKLPKDWPLMQDEASESPMYVKSMTQIPPNYIDVDQERWP